MVGVGMARATQCVQTYITGQAIHRERTFLPAPRPGTQTVRTQATKLQLSHIYRYSACQCANGLRFTLEPTSTFHLERRKPPRLARVGPLNLPKGPKHTQINLRQSICIVPTLAKSLRETPGVPPTLASITPGSPTVVRTDAKNSRTSISIHQSLANSTRCLNFDPPLQENELLEAFFRTGLQTKLLLQAFCGTGRQTKSLREAFCGIRHQPKMLREAFCGTSRRHEKLLEAFLGTGRRRAKPREAFFDTALRRK